MIAAKVICGAAGRASLDEIRNLVKQGANLNAMWRGYRPLPDTS